MRMELSNEAALGTIRAATSFSTEVSHDLNDRLFHFVWQIEF